VLLVLLTALGCGGSANVSGKVTYKGEPLPWGNVVIYGANGKIESGQISPDGTYAVHKAPVGEVKMAVIVSNPSPKTPPGQTLGKGPKTRPPRRLPPPPDLPPIKFVPIPDRYKEPDQSGLNFTLKSGEQTIDLDLQ
jgi:hypothetical protein